MLKIFKIADFSAGIRVKFTEIRCARAKPAVKKEVSISLKVLSLSDIRYK
jgi:hypothetical protein